jgi:anti-sigma28 factor (negative regulator of flagellin synthesis)
MGEHPSDDLAALKQKLLELTDGSPEREALLERLAERVRAGEYSVDARTLARKLIGPIDRNDSEDT